MSNIIPFQFEKHPIRVVDIDGGGQEFVAMDVVQGVGNVWKGTDSIKHVPEEWRGVQSVWTPSGEQEMLTLKEPGVYFFLNRSDKPSALPMQKWVAGEVLPSIRKTGAYAMPGVEFALPAPMMSAITQTVAALFDVYHSRILESAKAVQETSVIHGMTAGQIWDLHGLPKLKGAAGWLSRHLSKNDCDCRIDGAGRAMLGGRSAKLFNPEKAQARMKSGLLLACKQYVAERTKTGQGNLFKLK